MTTIKQWVNLPKDKRLLDHEEIFSEERLGALSPKLTFKAGDAGVAQVRLVPDGGNLVYADGKDAERSRNLHYNIQSQGVRTLKQAGPTDLDARDTVITLPACGGNKYYFEARDAAGKVVRSKSTVEAHRCLHYQVFASEGIFAHNPAGLAAMDDAVASAVRSFAGSQRNIRLVRVARDSAMPMTGVFTVRTPAADKVAGGNEPLFLALVQSQTKFVRKQLGVGIAFVPYLVKKMMRDLTFPATLQLKAGRGVLPGGIIWSYDGTAKKETLFLEIPAAMGFLWHGIQDPAEKPAFLRSLKLVWPSTKGVLPRDSTHVSLVAIPGAPKKKEYGGYRKFAVRLSDFTDLPNHIGGSAGLQMGLDTVHSWVNGRSYGTNVIAVATRVFFEDRAAEGVKDTLLHELGHRFGMVANGNRSKLLRWREHTPDAPSTYYDEETDKKLSHVGRHCKAGAPKQNTCIMYGSSGGRVGHDFCPDCGKALRKMDLTDITR